MVIQEIQAADTWPIRQKVMWPQKAAHFVKLTEDPQGTHYGLFQDRVLCSVISCFEDEGEMQFRKFATLTHQQGKGFGTVLLNYVISEVKGKGVTRLWCNARVDKIGFYTKFGFVGTKTTFVKEGVNFVIMEMRF